MKVIIVSKRHGGTRSYILGTWARAFLSVCLIGIPVGGISLAWQHFFSEKQDLLTADSTQAWEQVLNQQESSINRTRQNVDQKLAAMTLRIAELQARLVRLDALGERLTSMAKLDNGEFDFSRMPALGGPEVSIDEDAYAAPDFQEMLNQLSAQVEDRQQQLETLEALMAKRKLQNDVFLAGRPIKKGWMSSRFGRRTDPFNGHVAWHAGVDFAGKDGSDIVAVASGVVTWSGERSGYGNLIEINHGNGFKTRYGHCKKALVKVGDVVKKGQIVALMGSSGRSTGPHVHFEVYKHGRAVDPSTYIHRASR